MAFTALLKRLEIGRGHTAIPLPHHLTEELPHYLDSVTNGFCSTFKDWTIERAATLWAVGEAELAYNLGNNVESGVRSGQCIRASPAANARVSGSLNCLS